jgi:CRP-like cAMP-binding protein
LIRIKLQVDFLWVSLDPPAQTARVDSMAASKTRNPSGPPGGGPSIIVPDLWITGEKPGHPLTEDERALLAVIATVSRYKKGETIYREGEEAAAVFNIITGVVKSFKVLPENKQHVVGFLFPNDLIGLAEYGSYVNSAEAVTAVTLYRIPTKALETRLRQNARWTLRSLANFATFFERLSIMRSC